MQAKSGKGSTMEERELRDLDKAQPKPPRISWMLDYCRRERTDQVPTREVQRCGPGGLRDKAAFTAAVKELEELGRARTVQDGRKKLVQINPVLLVSRVGVSS